MDCLIGQLRTRHSRFVESRLWNLGVNESIETQITRNYFDVGFSALDDGLDNYNTQESSQWDGYAHYRRKRDKLFYNGTRLEESGPGGKLSIDQWKRVSSSAPACSSTCSATVSRRDAR